MESGNKRWQVIMAYARFNTSPAARAAMSNLRARFTPADWDALTLRDILDLFQQEMDRLCATTAGTIPLEIVSHCGWLN